MWARAPRSSGSHHQSRGDSRPGCPAECSSAADENVDVGVIAPNLWRAGLARTVALLEGLVHGDVAGRAVRVLDRLLDPIVFGVVAPWPLTHLRAA